MFTDLTVQAGTMQRNVPNDLVNNLNPISLVIMIREHARLVDTATKSLIRMYSHLRPIDLSCPSQEEHQIHSYQKNDSGLLHRSFGHGGSCNSPALYLR